MTYHTKPYKLHIEEPESLVHVSCGCLLETPQAPTIYVCRYKIREIMYTLSNHTLQKVAHCTDLLT